jgi:hypothetical protein
MLKQNIQSAPEGKCMCLTRRRWSTVLKFRVKPVFLRQAQDDGRQVRNDELKKGARPTCVDTITKS